MMPLLAIAAPVLAVLSDNPEDLDEVFTRACLLGQPALFSRAFVAAVQRLTTTEFLELRSKLIVDMVDRKTNRERAVLARALIDASVAGYSSTPTWPTPGETTYRLAYKLESIPNEIDPSRPLGTIYIRGMEKYPFQRELFSDDGPKSWARNRKIAAQSFAEHDAGRGEQAWIVEQRKREMVWLLLYAVWSGAAVQFTVSTFAYYTENCGFDIDLLNDDNGIQIYGGQPRQSEINLWLRGIHQQYRNSLLPTEKKPK